MSEIPIFLTVLYETGFEMFRLSAVRNFLTQRDPVLLINLCFIALLVYPIKIFDFTTEDGLSLALGSFILYQYYNQH